MPHRRSAAIVTAATAVAVFSAPILPSGSAASVESTKVEAVSPVDNGHLAAGYTIAHHYGNANCASGSPTTGTAYQCFTPASRVGIYNSCWVQSDHSYVVCLLAPWQRKATRLKVTRGYGDSSGFQAVHKPWGVRLGTDVRCLVILGPVHSIHGKPRTYLCNHKTVIAGKVEHHGARWTADVYRKVHHDGRRASYRSLGTQTAAIVWFGQPSLKDSSKN
jgi:hypothetical protein